MSLCIFESALLPTREVLKEQRQERFESFSRVALAPVFGVQHVSYFWGSDSSHETDDARAGFGFGVGGREKLDHEVPAVLAVVAALDPFS